MKTIWIAILVLALPCEHAFAWGQEGHSIVAELAERRLDQPTLEKIRLLLKPDIPLATQDTRVSLGSIASWADDYRAEHGETRNWHFVNIPFDRGTYDPQVDCKADPKFVTALLTPSSGIGLSLLTARKRPPSVRRRSSSSFISSAMFTSRCTIPTATTMAETISV